MINKFNHSYKVLELFVFFLLCAPQFCFGFNGYPNDTPDDAVAAVNALSLRILVVMIGVACTFYFMFSSGRSKLQVCVPQPCSEPELSRVCHCKSLLIVNWEKLLFRTHHALRQKVTSCSR